MFALFSGWALCGAGAGAGCGWVWVWVGVYLEWPIGPALDYGSPRSRVMSAAWELVVWADLNVAP